MNQTQQRYLKKEINDEKKKTLISLGILKRESEDNSIPDFYRLCSGWELLGNLVRDVQSYYELFKTHPLIPQEYDYERVVEYDYGLLECKKILEEIEKNYNIENNEFLKKNPKCNYLYHLIRCNSLTGKIANKSEDEQRLLCEIIDTEFYINYKQNRRADYKYNNRRRYLEMKVTSLELTMIGEIDESSEIIELLDDIDKNSTWYNATKKSDVKLYTIKKRTTSKQ